MEINCPICHKDFSAEENIEETFDISGGGVYGRIVENNAFTCPHCGGWCAATMVFKTQMVNYAIFDAGEEGD